MADTLERNDQPNGQRKMVRIHATTHCKEIDNRRIGIQIRIIDIVVNAGLRMLKRNMSSATPLSLFNKSLSYFEDTPAL